MKTLLIALIFLSACSHVRMPPPRFEPSVLPSDRSVSSAADVDKLWVHVNNRKDSLIRSNPTHYWAWVNENTPENLKKIAGYKGVIIADAHYFNFGDVHGEKKNGLAVVDVDDSGQGSYYLDFVRYSIFVKAYLENNFTAELFDAYVDGLSQKKKDLPKFLSDPISKSRKDLELENASWVKKNLKKDYQLDNDSLGLTGFKKLRETSPEKVKTGIELGELLLRDKKAKKIYDSAYLVTDSGSSRGMNRYWFSMMTNENDMRIVECKQLSEPATAYSAKQKQHAERIAEVVKFYSDVEVKDSYVFNTPFDSYWCRPKHFDFFSRSEVEDSRKDMKKMLEYSRYLAYWMGYKQSYQRQADQLLKELKSNPKKIINDTVDLINVYETHVFDLGKKTK